jgi:3'(2'), 5'-bisphosphate nucleotidase
VLEAIEPDDGILSEESVDTEERLSKERVWIVDPLDGTREFSEGRDDWAVHVALTMAGQPVAAALALPARNVLLRSDRPVPPAHRPARSPIMLVSRTRPPAGAEQCRPRGRGRSRADGLCRRQGGGGDPTGEADIYLHAGGQHEWDNCAPVGVALAAGLHASRLDGSPIRYNQAHHARARSADLPAGPRRAG